MSDYEDSPYDEEDIKAMYDDEEGVLKPEDVFNMVMINKKRMVKTSISLKDSNNETITVPQVVEDLLKYIDKKIKDKETNQFSDQIMPLMSNVLVSGLGRLIGIREAGFYLCNETTQSSLLYMMSLSFLMLKYVQQKNITIETSDEPVSQQELEDLMQRSSDNRTAVLSSMVNDDLKSVILNMIKSGSVSSNELEELVNDLKKSN